MRGNNILCCFYWEMKKNYLIIFIQTQCNLSGALWAHKTDTWYKVISVPFCFSGGTELFQRCVSTRNKLINPIALRKAKIVNNFGPSECDRVEMWYCISVFLTSICVSCRSFCGPWKVNESVNAPKSQDTWLSGLYGWIHGTL